MRFLVKVVCPHEFKDEVQYGTRQATRDEAGRLLADLEEFARWAEELL